MCVRSFTQKMHLRNGGGGTTRLLELCEECKNSHMLRLHADMRIPASVRVNVALADRFHELTESGLKVDFLDAMNELKRQLARIPLPLSTVKIKQAEKDAVRVRKYEVHLVPS